MFAVIKTGGKQYLVHEGDRLKIEKIIDAEGKEINIKEVLLVSSGQDVEIGQPFLKDVSIKAKVVAQGKAKKVTIFKYKKRKGYHKKQGHRQKFTEIKIEKIIGSKIKPIKEKTSRVSSIKPKANTKPKVKPVLTQKPTKKVKK
jgi:large subunit ribosomal protein L21